MVATAFVTTLDKPERFRGAHQIESFLGLVLQERSSGEKQHKGPITKSGNGRMRWLTLGCRFREEKRLRNSHARSDESHRTLAIR